ncbi:hypothetical protein CC80DRAFT_510755 [Byssothecium circinans]|uniref:Uncharacterized protein n=1 Tax=Byssothecium circinans TaxID=147558 RepID=A0A6A5TBX0_9PLEO|nr:hypothetical protein CC80DRAFT_510755 [Byssothecium circinans]
MTQRSPLKQSRMLLGERSSHNTYSIYFPHFLNELRKLEPHYAIMGNHVSKFIHDCVTRAKDVVVNAMRQILPPVVQYVVEHPIQTVAHVATALVVAAPGIVAGPLLAVAGFAGGGIAAGSMAAGVQSTIGAVSAGSTFATLQSAAMGGYGAATVAGAVAGAAVAADGVNVAVQAARR